MKYLFGFFFAVVTMFIGFLLQQHVTAFFSDFLLGGFRATLFFGVTMFMSNVKK